MNTRRLATCQRCAPVPLRLDDDAGATSRNHLLRPGRRQSDSAPSGTSRATRLTSWVRDRISSLE